MTTARDVIAKAICWGAKKIDHCECKDGSSCAYYEDADNVISALLSAPESVRFELAGLLNSWRPIETAPTDGTEFLAWAPSAHGLPSMYSLCAWYRDAGFYIDELREATKWLPLPAPPSEDKACYQETLALNTVGGHSYTNDIGKMATTLGLFASVIKSGETWTGTCEQAQQEAHEALKHICAQHEVLMTAAKVLYEHKSELLYGRREHDPVRQRIETVLAAFRTAGIQTGG